MASPQKGVDRPGRSIRVGGNAPSEKSAKAHQPLGVHVGQAAHFPAASSLTLAPQARK